MKLTFVLTKSKNSRWWAAECPEIPGALSQGRTESSAKNNLKDAIRKLNKARRAFFMKQPSDALASFGEFKVVTVEA